MISIEQAHSQQDQSLASQALFSAPPINNYVITNFSMDVTRNFVSDTYSLSNTYSLNFQGVILDLSVTADILSTSIRSKINALFDKSKFDYKVKSLTFPSDNENSQDLKRTAKFSISFEVRDAVPSAHTDFTEGVDDLNEDEFDNLLPKLTIVPFGKKLRDISESFNIDDSEDGGGTFTHSINFSLMPAPNPATGVAPNPIRPDSQYFRTQAKALVEALTVYTTFVDLVTLFDPNEQPYSNFKKEFFSQNETFTHAESFDLFNFTYSLTRTKKFYKNNSVPQSCFFHSYNLEVNEEGIIEITEETKVEGKTRKIGDVRQALEAIEGQDQTIYGENNNLYKKVKNSYGRCQTFLQNYKRLLRYNTSNALIGLDYSTSSGIDSLRPIAIEKNTTLIPGSPDAVYSVKYTTNPNVNFGYECDESIKADVSNGIFNIVHSINLKTFNFKDEQRSLFPSSLGNNAYGSDYTSYVNNKKIESRARIKQFLNSPKVANTPYLPVPSLAGILKGLKRNANPIGLALIKQSTNVSERGKNLSLTLTYSSENKYGPLLYDQDPTDSSMFYNLGLPPSVFPFLKNHFLTFDVKVSTKLPVEKFTQKVIVQKPHAIIEPSFSTSIGNFSIVFSGRLKKSQMGVVLPITGDEINNFKVKSNFENIIRNVRAKILQGSAMTHLKAMIKTITQQYFFDSSTKIIPPTAFFGGSFISCIPTNVSYKYTSSLDFQMTVDLEFYFKKRLPGGPVFYYKNQINDVS